MAFSDYWFLIASAVALPNSFMEHFLLIWYQTSAHFQFLAFVRILFLFFCYPYFGAFHFHLFYMYVCVCASVCMRVCVIWKIPVFVHKIQ